MVDDMIEKHVTFTYRNPGHWDVCNLERRLFRVRGGPGRYWISDERDYGGKSIEVKTIDVCMSYICSELMHELIIAEGQTPTTIESWNI